VKSEQSNKGEKKNAQKKQDDVSVEPEQSSHSFKLKNEGEDTKVKREEIPPMPEYLLPQYALRQITKSIPRNKLPTESLPARAAYQLIADELKLDCNPLLNLASFVTTWMEQEAVQLFQETAGVNYIDMDTYPQTAIVHDRVMRMQAELFNAPNPREAWGTSTAGSSEAAMLALLAHKWNWKLKREKAGLPTDKPNIIFGAHAHTVIEKFGVYFDVESRIIYLDEPNKQEKENKDTKKKEHDPYVPSVEKIKESIDENTIAILAIAGSTFTGSCDSIEEINDLLIEIKKTKGWDIPIHIDAASAGFVLPFLNPDRLWDFRLEHVQTINVSNHKYGLVFPGMGSVIFRKHSLVPEKLRFQITYLGGTMDNYSLNFSRPASPIIIQYYQFLRLGRKGYTQLMKNLMEIANYAEEKLLETGVFESISKQKCIPIVVLIAKDEKSDVRKISQDLRKYGWMIPAYPLPAKANKIYCIRIVVKETFTHDLANNLVKDIKKVLKAEEEASSNGRGGQVSHHPIC